MPEKYEIMRTVSEGLNSLTINPWGYAKATKAVKTILCEIGQDKFGCYVCASGVHRADYREWLYDVTWLEYDCDGSPLIDAHLAAECEWGNPGDIDDDFQKLLLARASVRLMIFGGWDECGSKRRLEWMANKIGKFKPSRDEDAWLLVACEGSAIDGWSFRSFTIRDNAAIPFQPSLEG